MFRKAQLIVDDSYQRRSIWLPKDKVAFIETILLKYVVPELFFWKSEINSKTGESVTHIVDGQQRIKAIDDFIEEIFPLHTDFLLEEYSKNRWGQKTFSQLTEDEQKAFWEYRLNIIEIDSAVTRKEITKMFVRLNLTDYNLNDQERRNSNSGMFASCAKTIAQNVFWDKHKLFNRTDIRRMKDVEFCTVLLLLYRNGITDQPNQSPLNKAYEDYAENYPDAERDQKAVINAITEVEKLINKETLGFLRKRGQLYTVFSIVLPMIEQARTFDAHSINQFAVFVSLYENFVSDYALPTDAPNIEKEMLEDINKYKLASSEGLNKHANRMRRRNILSRFLFELSPSHIDAQKILFGKLKEHKENKKKEKAL